MVEKVCPKCGTVDCISSEEYKKHIKITGAGILSVDSNILLKSCKVRQDLKLWEEHKKSASNRIIRP